MSVVINGSAGVTTNSGAVYNGIFAGTAVASTSGTSIDFTSIPSWVKRITVMFAGVSTSGTSNIWLQLGTSGGIDAASYVGASSYGGSGTTVWNTNGFIVNNNVTAATNQNGIITLVNISANTWCESANIYPNATNQGCTGGGSKTLSGTLDRIRITTANGTDTFDAGSINILYE